MWFEIDARQHKNNQITQLFQFRCTMDTPSEEIPKELQAHCTESKYWALVSPTRYRSSKSTSEHASSSDDDESDNQLDDESDDDDDDKSEDNDDDDDGLSNDRLTYSTESKTITTTWIA